MANFLDNAKSVLEDGELSTLTSLAEKTANFDTNSEEDKQFMELKMKVKRLLAEKDKDKNLAFLSDNDSFTLQDVIRVMKPKKETVILKDILSTIGYTKDEISKTVKAMFPAVATAVSEPIATYKIGEVDTHFKNGERLKGELPKAIKAGKEKGFVKHLTEFGKKYMLVNHEATGGPFAGDTIYDNIGKICTKFAFDPATLKKELGIKEGKEAK